MEAIARLGLFGFAYIVLYIISNLVAAANKIDGTSPVFFENFHGVSFLLGGWIYFIHIFDENKKFNNMNKKFDNLIFNFFINNI